MTDEELQIDHVQEEELITIEGRKILNLDKISSQKLLVLIIKLLKEIPDGKLKINSQYLIKYLGTQISIEIENKEFHKYYSFFSENGDLIKWFDEELSVLT